MIDRVVSGSRYLAVLAVVGSFVASATVPVRRRPWDRRRRRARPPGI